MRCDFDNVIKYFCCCLQKADKCIECAAGSECSDPTKEGVECEAGFWSAKASIKCSPCDPGFACKVKHNKCRGS